MIILEVFLSGFVTAFGWWSANHYVIEPYLPKSPPAIEKKIDEKAEKSTETSTKD